jgi:hypothetical protein
MNAQQVVNDHLRAIENGDWERALSFIAETYTMTGIVPFPISLFVKIRKSGALTMHQARRRALPDFKFNESYLEVADDHVKIQVNLTGTQTGTIDYRGILRGIPVIPPTNKAVKLNPEYFTYYVQNNMIYKIIGDIPKNAGVQGLVKAVSQEQ